MNFQKFIPAALLLLPFLGTAQRWELGLTAGAAAYAGDLYPGEYFDVNGARPAIGVFVNRHFNRLLGVRLQYAATQFSGDDARFSEPSWRPLRAISFTTLAHETSLALEWDILGRLRIRDRKVHRLIGPYVFAGPAAVLFKANTDYNEGENGNPALPPGVVAADRTASNGSPLLTVIGGGGLKMYTGRHWTIGIEAAVRPTMNDYLDGVSKSGNSENNDWYASAGFVLTYRFLYKDTDADGVANRDDKCPLAPGLRDLHGCPDEDGDGITDSDDHCPMLAGVSSAFGCPDRDGDTVTDSIDRCPSTAGLATLNGCPDRDSDGIIDPEDRCPDEAGVSTLRGCPDRDGDGVGDQADKCPDAGGKVDYDGCPIVDKDEDTVADDVDRCPTEKGPVALQGCPDGDGDNVPDRFDTCPETAGFVTLAGCPDQDADGVADAEDLCPSMSGPATSKGCPELRAEDKKAIDVAVRNIQFENNSHRLKPESQPVLDKVVEILQRYPNYRVAIAGHTDNVGNAKSNLTLSTRRAKSCRDYLAAHGIAAERLSAKGYGKTKPIASNKTTEGRKKNRRVEFNLVNNL